MPNGNKEKTCTSAVINFLSKCKPLFTYLLLLSDDFKPAVANDSPPKSYLRITGKMYGFFANETVNIHATQGCILEVSPQKDKEELALREICKDKSYPHWGLLLQRENNQFFGTIFKDGELDSSNGDGTQAILDFKTDPRLIIVRPRHN